MQADLRLCWSHKPHCWKSHALALFISGAMFSSLAAIQIIGMIVSVASENTIYSVTVSVMDGFVFLVLAGLCVIQLILLM